MNIEDLVDPVNFIYVAMTQSAISFKESGKNKDYYLSYCDEIWNSMELLELETLKDILKTYVKNEIKTRLHSLSTDKEKKV